MILTTLNHYKFELVGAFCGYTMAYREKQLRWGRYANGIYTHPFYSIIGIGIGYSIKHLPNILISFFNLF